MAADSTMPTYSLALSEYLSTHGEEALYQASLLSQAFIESGLGPEDIIALHFETLDEVTRDRSHFERLRSHSDAQTFLLEIMIAYGVKYREYLELRLREGLRDAEAQTALERERALNAERLERERSEILAMIAHELRTPLTAALGTIDLAARSVERGQLERLETYLSRARDALRRLSRLSADLVEASRGEPTQINLALTDLGPILDQACAWAGPVAAEKGIILSCTSVPAQARLVADGDALISVFGNLLSNAIRYTPSGGKVTVSTEVRDGQVQVSVADTGIGMDPAVAARIFEKFYRADNARATEAQGLGLGLSLVQQLVEAHHGRVEVESAVGVGSTFRIILPAAATNDQEA